MTDPAGSSRRVTGSFRDPSGYVFRREGRIFRAIDDGTRSVLDELVRGGVIGSLVDDGLLVPTSIVDDADLESRLAEENPPFETFLEHERIDPVSFPYEWTVSMLADAALLTLDLQSRLIEQGWSLKDATAFNVQFRRGRPVFIDVASIEKPQRVDLWPALGQFGPMFTFPLLLAVHQGWDLRTYFLANIGGLSVERVARIIGRSGRWRPRAWLDVTLPNWFGGRKVGKQTDVNEVLARPTKRDHRAQLMNLNRLRSKIEKLARSYRPQGVWATYTASCSYDDQADAAKQDLVRSYLSEHRPETVLDLGCNTGVYTRIAVECGARAVAVDSDHDAAEILYSTLRDEPGDVLPLVLDLGSPSPGVGYMNREREPFVERARSECVLALALVHHLLVTGNLPPAAVRDLLRELTTDHLVVEFVPKSDPMFVELLKRRVGPFDEISEEAFLAVFGEAFSLVRKEPIPNTQRTLLFLRVDS